MDEINQAISILKSGGVVIFPTDTAFGIGCRIDDEKAVERLFKIRRRPPIQATPVLVSGIAMAENYFRSPPPEIKKLMAEYWPGGLTIIYYGQIEKIPSLVRGGGTTIGLRQPDHPITQQIIAGVGVPILGPSANFHGESTPYSTVELNPELVKLVDFVVPGECTFKKASTVIDCTTEPWKIIRPGAVKIKNQNSKIKIQSDGKPEAILEIDTSDSSYTSVIVRSVGKLKIYKEATGENKSQNVLPLITKALQQEKLTLTEITGIRVNPGPGSFTGVRVGVTVANTLGWVLGIPVNGKKIELPRYAQSKFD